MNLPSLARSVRLARWCAIVTVAFFAAGFAVALLFSAADGAVLEFSSASCGPCRQMAPVIEQARRSGADIRSVDADARPDLVGRYSVTVLPTFIVVDDSGNELARAEGTMPFGSLLSLASAEHGSTGGPGYASSRNWRITAVGLTDDDADALLAWCRKYRRDLYAQWFGSGTLPDWPQPADVRISSGDPGGATSWAFSGGTIVDPSGSWYGTKGNMCEQVVPHEVFHLVWNTALPWPHARWLDEGIATSCESPDSDAYGSFFAMAHDWQRAGKLPAILAACSPKDEPEVSDYVLGVPLVTFLLEQPQGRQGLVDLARAARETGWRTAFVTVYHAPPERVQTAFCGWLLRQPRNGPARRFVGGILCHFRNGLWRPAQRPNAPAAVAGNEWHGAPVSGPGAAPAATQAIPPSVAASVVQAAGQSVAQAAPPPNAGTTGAVDDSHYEATPLTMPPASQQQSELTKRDDGDAGGVLFDAAGIVSDSIGWALLKSLTTYGAAAFGPIGGVVGVAAWLIARRASKRVAAMLEGEAEQSADGFPAGAERTYREVVETQQPIERDDSEAKQLLRLRQLEGRDPLQDALAGSLYTTRLETLAASSRDTQKASWARELLNEVHQRFNEIAPTKFSVSVPTQE